jgi:ADP-heptose:LPS heptosyltransferase
LTTQLEYSKLTGIKKIAVLRANAVGDYIFALPALEALRAAYPDAEIVLLGRSWHADFLSGRPSPVDRVMVTPWSTGVNMPNRLEVEEWEENPAELASFFEQARGEQFDLALQMHGGGFHSNPFLLKLGARITAGMRTPDAPPLDRWMPYKYWQHEVLRLLECVSLVGAEPVTLRPRIEITEVDRAAAMRFFPDPAARIAVLHPGATDPRRHWSEQNFAQVGDALAEDGYQLAIIGMPGEREKVERIVQSLNAPAHNLAGQLSLKALTGLLSRAEILIANDSGPLHLAEALDTPSVGIYWAGNMINFGPVTTSFHRQLLSWRLDCPVCGRDTIYENCEHSESFVNRVSAEEVLAEARDLLAYVDQVRVQ